MNSVLCPRPSSFSKGASAVSRHRIRCDRCPSRPAARHDNAREMLSFPNGGELALITIGQKQATA